MCYVSRETMLPAVVEAVTNYDGKVWILLDGDGLVIFFGTPVN